METDVLTASAAVALLTQNLSQQIYLWQLHGFVHLFDLRHACVYSPYRAGPAGHCGASPPAGAPDSAYWPPAGAASPDTASLSEAQTSPGHIKNVKPVKLENK